MRSSAASLKCLSRIFSLTSFNRVGVPIMHPHKKMAPLTSPAAIQRGSSQASAYASASSQLSVLYNVFGKRFMVPPGNATMGTFFSVAIFAAVRAEPSPP